MRSSKPLLPESAGRPCAGTRWIWWWLDIMLPDGDGVELCRELKERYQFLFCFSVPWEKAGTWWRACGREGDDYLAKPYDLEVLAARVEARLRQERTRSRYVSYGNLRLDTLSGCGYLGDTDLLLTQKDVRGATSAGPQCGEARACAESSAGGMELRKRRTTTGHSGP